MRQIFVNDNELGNAMSRESKQKSLRAIELLIAGRQRAVENHLYPFDPKQIDQEQPNRHEKNIRMFQMEMRGIQHARRISISKNKWNDAEPPVMKERRVDLPIRFIWIGPDPYFIISQPPANSVYIN